MDCFYLKQGLSLSYYTILQCNAILLAASLVSSLVGIWLVSQIRQYTPTNQYQLHIVFVYHISDIWCWVLEISVRLCFYACFYLPSFPPGFLSFPTTTTKVRYTDGWCFLLWFVVNRWRLVSLISIRFISLHTYYYLPTQHYVHSVCVRRLFTLANLLFSVLECASVFSHIFWNILNNIQNSEERLPLDAHHVLTLVRILKVWNATWDCGSSSSRSCKLERQKFAI